MKMDAGPSAAIRTTTKLLGHLRALRV